MTENDTGGQIISRTVAVDFDGVIHDYDGWRDGSIYGGPVDGAFDALSWLLSKYYVVIHTSRSPGQVVAWLESHGFTAVRDSLKFDETSSTNIDGTPGLFWDSEGILLVTRRKYAAIAYIDDRAIRFLDWDQALTDLERITRG